MLMNQPAAPLYTDAAIVGSPVQEYSSPRAETTDSWAQPSTTREAGERVQIDPPTRGFISRRFGRVGALAAAGLMTVALIGCSSDSTSSTAARPSEEASAERSNETTEDPTVTTVLGADPSDTAEPTSSEAAGIVGPAVDPVAFDAVAEFGNGVTARILSIAPVSISATMPGQTSGPGMEVQVEVTNGSASAIDLSRVTVDLADADGASHQPGDPTGMAGFSGELPAGSTATGTYQYRVDPAAPRDARLTIKYSATTPTVVFAGSIPNE